MSSRDTETVPVLWINLERGDHRRRRMLKALAAGGWTHQRIEQIVLEISRHNVIFTRISLKLFLTIL